MPFPFLQLPTEIRLPIYRLLLPYSEYHVEGQRNDSPVRWYTGRYHCSSILLVNRQVHREAAEILYRDNFFAIYVKHPREPRLPMNNSRADSESFMFVSWAQNKSPNIVKAKMNWAWAHPRNPRVSWSTLEKHQSFHHIRNFHISLPSFDGLSGVDMFMKKTSFAAFKGVKAWSEKCANKGGCLDVAEGQRMCIVQQYKDPIDQLGRLLQDLERIDRLCISAQISKFQITFSDYLLEELLKVGVVGNAACYFATPLTSYPGESQLRRWKDLLESTPKKPRKESQLPPEADGMYRLLRAVRAYQQDSAQTPDWLSPVPA